MLLGGTLCLSLFQVHPEPPEESWETCPLRVQGSHTRSSPHVSGPARVGNRDAGGPVYSPRPTIRFRPGTFRTWGRVGRAPDSGDTLPWSHRTVCVLVSASVFRSGTTNKKLFVPKKRTDLTIICPFDFSRGSCKKNCKTTVLTMRRRRRGLNPGLTTSTEPSDRNSKRQTKHLMCDVVCVCSTPTRQFLGL